MADELGRLLAQVSDAASASSSFDFRVGVVESFDSATGANVVRVRGADIPNVPMLNIGDTVNLTAGDNVVVLKYRTGYFILGRVVHPNSEALATGAVLPATGTVSVSGYGITTTSDVVASVTLTAPPWSNAVSVFASVSGSGRNNRGVVDFLYHRVNINGSDGAEEFGQGDASPNPSWANATASFAGSGLLPGGNSFDIQAKVRAGGAWTAHATNQCDLTYSVMYLKV